MIKNTIGFIGAIFFVSFAIAGPLGLEKGMKLNELKKHGNFSPTHVVNVYVSTSLLRGYPDAEAYSVVVSPIYGLCKILVATKYVNTGQYGYELKNKFDELKGALSKKYGVPKNHDFLHSGSIWNEPRDWMMSLAKKERTLSSFWTLPENQMQDSIEAISIEAIAIGNNKGYIQFGYEFDNIDKCSEEMKEKSNANL